MSIPNVARHTQDETGVFMHTFRRHMLRQLQEALTNPACRYVDNSLSYYAGNALDAMQNDKDWFAHHKVPDPDSFIKENTLAIEAQVQTKAFLYSRLADAHSRKMLLLVALFSLLGHRFVKFPYHAPQARTLRATLAQQHAATEADDEMRLAVSKDAFGVGFPLALYTVDMAGIPVTLYAATELLYQLAAFPPYRYSQGRVCIDVSAGDHVLDCGACYGDTALLFAAKAQADGRVLSFEPHPFISRLYAHNLQRNPVLAARVELVPRPTGADQHTEVSLILRGAGSCLGQPDGAAPDTTLTTTTLDAEVDRRQWERADFIKMDVEGAELATLKGAEQTLRRFRPKLAICLYHHPLDFFTIPHYLSSLNLGYAFYLEHHYVNEWETVLYAIAP